ncbi:hypothetical protein [Streptomyces profundus]|uniref:hypothetical protein n=1 Tax=Streptomyces profundus TaxID=2867410 RepID=UPI001D16879A|nr:hypothetical protein [Streptomyces sp. MA3_2.13]UED86635.1 hypothetical protein K4G22_22570 [Streptomyces sp. MA3_2.13]
MNVGSVVAAVLLSLSVVLCVLLVWGEAVSEWRALRVPPRPHDPARYFTRRRHSWAKAPETLRDWQVGGPSPDGKARGPVRVARIVAVLGGESSEEGGEVPARLRLALADGGTTLIHTELSNALNVTPGAFLPIRRLPQGGSSLSGDTWEPAWELPAHEVGRVLLDHRHALGLVDDDGYRVLCQRLSGEPESAPVTAVRPTGAVRAGQVEVDLVVTAGGRPALVRGFLRPEEIATARHTGRVPVTRSTRGGWVLWPTWH